MTSIVQELFGESSLTLGSIFGALAIGSGWLMDRFGRGMKAGGGRGIVAFEFSGSRSKANAILEEWGGPGQKSARAALWLDFSFLIGYGGLLAVIAVWMSEALHRRNWEGSAEIGLWMAVAAIFAAALDAIENISLLTYLRAYQTEQQSALPIKAAFVCAGMKFVLLAVVILAMAVGGVVLGARTE